MLSYSPGQSSSVNVRDCAWNTLTMKYTHTNNMCLSIVKYNNCAAQYSELCQFTILYK